MLVDIPFAHSLTLYLYYLHTRKFSYFDKVPSFQLLQVGRDEQHWWRVYTLEIIGVECNIKEVFPDNLFEIDFLQMK